MSKGVSAHPDTDEINTEFRPGKEEEVKEFVTTFVELDESEQDDIWDELNKGQKKAYDDSVQPKAVDLTQPSEESGLIQTQSGWDYNRVFQFDVYGNRNVKAFSLFHEISWDVYDEGSVIDREIEDADNNGWVEDIIFGWTDEGNTKDRVTGVGSSTASSVRRRRMDYASSPGGLLTHYPETEVYGTSPGGWGVRNCDDDGIGDIEGVDINYDC